MFQYLGKTWIDKQFHEHLESYKSELAERRSDKDARRDYEYEARKKLYLEIEPLLFQVHEQVESLLHRIYSLALFSSQGKLGDLLLPGTYYRLSTPYRLLAPYATFKLVQRRLTFVDLSLDLQSYRQYEILKKAYQTLPDDFTLAKRKEDELNYMPKGDQAKALKHEQPKIYWRQGVPSGILDNAVDSLIAKEADSSLRVKSYAEFESEYKDEQSNVSKCFKRIDYLFEEFHPASRPVLWRILIVNGLFYKLLFQLRGTSTRSCVAKPEMKWPKEDRRKYDWRDSSCKIPDNVVFEIPFTIAENYVKEKLSPMLSALQESS